MYDLQVMHIFRLSIDALIDLEKNDELHHQFFYLLIKYYVMTVVSFLLQFCEN
jgi:hypothetical protein